MRQVHFGEPGDPCWIIDLRYPQEHQNIEMDECYSYFCTNCPHVVSFVERKINLPLFLVSVSFILHVFAAVRAPPTRYFYIYDRGQPNLKPP